VGKICERIEPDLAQWLTAQLLFVVSTAPLDAEGR